MKHEAAAMLGITANVRLRRPNVELNIFPAIL
jgi:hypothetical protein